MANTIKLPWVVIINPDYYDDDNDNGFTWEGEACTEQEAIALACISCDHINWRLPSEALKAHEDFDPADYNDPLDPDTVGVSLSEPDFKALLLKIWRTPGAEIPQPYDDMVKAALDAVGAL